MPAKPNRNRRRHANALPIAQIATWLLLAVFLGGGGLYYVYCKNQLQFTGATIKRLERERDEILTQREFLQGTIARLSSRAALERRRAEGFFNLIPITDDRIVRVGVSSAAGEGDLRAVANERTAP